MENIKAYFKACAEYWMRNGDAPSVAYCKAFWWDCVEAWNAGHSWNDEKEQFAAEWRGYHKGDPTPEARAIECGQA